MILRLRFALLRMTENGYSFRKRIVDSSSLNGV